MMQIKNIPSPVLAAAVGMLQPFAPALTPAGLVAALKQCGDEKGKFGGGVEKAYSRKDAAEALGVSVHSVARYLKAGRLRFTKLGRRLVRIDPQSVRDLLSYTDAGSVEK